MKPLLAWAVNSMWFRKWSNTLGSFALGLWVSARYWRQIRATCEVWGIERDAWMGFLLAIIGASGVLLSLGLSIENQKKAKGKKP
jgi:hypothetical protein